ncbi:MAG: 8-oxo-dGTP diphosphatase [Bacilli bacterium]|nr:8-oxo-dGTP diphosphatase [Bacilli bacterium]
MGKIILTTMTMVYKDDGTFLVQNRVKNDWPGLNFPGGHVEENESIEDSAIREIEEETGLKISELENVGSFEWNLLDKKERHLCILFRTNKFEGELKSSKEGNVFFIKKEEVPNYPLSTDFDKLLEIMLKGLNLSI